LVVVTVVVSIGHQHQEVLVVDKQVLAHSGQQAHLEQQDKVVQVVQP
jgi:hypothetical protein